MRLYELNRTVFISLIRRSLVPYQESRYFVIALKCPEPQIPLLLAALREVHCNCVSVVTDLCELGQTDLEFDHVFLQLCWGHLVSED